MPRTADHDARRAQICDALLAVALREGLPHVTIPKVAAQAGISIGLVQHYYRSKDALIADTHTVVIDRIEHRADAAVTAAEQRHERIEHILAEALTELLPLDPQRRDEWYLSRAFAAAALDSDELRATLVASELRMRARVAGAIANGRDCGEVTGQVDEHLEAAALLAHVSGLADQIAWDTGVPVPQVRRVIARDCAAIFPGPCSRERTGPGTRQGTGPGTRQG